MSVITRIAPSPTGTLHVGTARTALFNYLYAKRHGGKFLLRIEDTDRERSKPEFEEDIVRSLRWLGLSWDGESRQSERVAEHRAALEKLVAAERAYISEEPAKDAPTKMRALVRFRNPGGSVIFEDEIRGEVSTDVTDLGDFIIAKSVDEPLYHLAVVVDDIDSGVTHVIRGEDHISNTARQILIIEALGAARPIYAHLPLMLAADRSKLSKRHGAISVSSFAAEGYLPEAFANFLASLGWNPGGEEEVFALGELERIFDLYRVSKAGAIFNIEKLRWFNREHLRHLPADELRAGIETELAAVAPDVPAERRARIVDGLRERISVFSDVRRLAAEGEFAYAVGNGGPTSVDPAALPGKGNETPREAAERLPAGGQLLSELPKAPFDQAAVKAALWPYAEAEGKAAVLWPVRYALSGRERSPDPFELAAVLGKTETVTRLAAAAEALDAAA